MVSPKLLAWAGWFVLLLFLDFFIPFKVLREVEHLKGSFLFWTLWGLVAIASMFVMFWGWTQPDSSNRED